MFNLEQAIADWRRRAAWEGLASDVLDELESHLRDEIARQICDGAEPGRAFQNAVHLLGETAQLNEEFAKATGVTPVNSKELLEAARAEAGRMGHNFIGTEHLLLGLLKIGKGTVESSFSGSSLCFESVRHEIEHLIGPQKTEAGSADLPLTPRAQKALKIAESEAVRFRQPLLTANHFLLGLILEGDGLGARVLKKMGVGAKQIRKLLLS